MMELKLGNHNLFDGNASCDDFRDVEDFDFTEIEDIEVLLEQLKQKLEKLGGKNEIY